ncbi:flagellar export chaperone FlgN [Alteromonas sp. CYL-A6]|uniref:flagellar export chaperone FlgN n=1 Tax=Alteromonas nitratireducens TaxID=3390813 RepID=UPI0034B04136
MQSLQSLLTRQIENLNELVLLLESELHHISSRDAEALMTLLEKKSQILEDIQALDKNIDTAYQAATSTSPADPETQSLIDKAQALVEDCKYRTEINQKAVEQGQLRLSHLRNLMLEVRAKESLTYDKSGKPKGSGLGPGVSA